MAHLRDRLKFKFQPSGIICFVDYTSIRGCSISVQLRVRDGNVPDEQLAELAYMIAGSEHVNPMLIHDEIGMIYRESPSLEAVRQQARTYEREQQAALAGRRGGSFTEEFDIID